MLSLPNSQNKLLTYFPTSKATGIKIKKRNKYLRSYSRYVNDRAPLCDSRLEKTLLQAFSKLLKIFFTLYRFSQSLVVASAVKRATRVYCSSACKANLLKNHFYFLSLFSFRLYSSIGHHFTTSSYIIKIPTT